MGLETLTEEVVITIMDSEANKEATINAEDELIHDGVQCFIGTFIHCINKRTDVEILSDKIVGVQNGKIVFVEDIIQLENIRNDYGVKHENIHMMHFGQFMIPGLVDCHVHASQYVYCGTALDLELLEWLEKYTFPTEAKFSDPEFAETSYIKAVERLLKHGTTTACYFATIHTDSTLILCDVAERCGQRALVGKVNMDRNSPDNYIEESADKSLQETERFVEEVLSRNYKLIQPVVTPRFVPTCTTDLQRGLGQLAKKHDLYIQSHLSESKAECEWVKTLHPESSSYTEVYEKSGLLTNKTVMAHSIHLSDSELSLMKKNGAAIAHCPNSNVSLVSGLLDARKILDLGIKMGLGTDLAGGYHPSLLDAMRYALSVSNILSIQKNGDYKPLVYQDVFRIATLGGAEALNMGDKLGSFEVGKDFDAILVDPHTNHSPIDAFEDETIDEMFQKFIYLGDDRNITEVYVQGRKVWPQQGRTTADRRSRPCSMSTNMGSIIPVCTCGENNEEVFTDSVSSRGSRTDSEYSTGSGSRRCSGDIRRVCSIRRDSDFNILRRFSLPGTNGIK